MKINKYIYMMLAASLGLSACDTEEQETALSPIPQQEQSCDLLRFSASSDGSLQKTSLNGSSACFVKTDELAVFSNGVASKFAVGQIMNSGREALFEGKAEKADEYFALYPYNAATKIDGNLISAKLPSAQKAYQGNFDFDAAVMAGHTTEADMSFTMKNATSIINVYSGIPFSKVTIETLDKTPIAGDYTITIDKDGVSQISGGTESVITAEAVDGVVTDTYINVIPAKIKAGNLKITIVRQDGSVKEEVIDKDVELLRSVRNTFAPKFIVTINLSAIGKDPYDIKVTEGYNAYLSDDTEYLEGKEWGYSSKKDGDIEYYMGDRFIPTANTTLYLVNQDFKYAINIDANGGKFEDGSSVKSIKHAVSSWCDPRDYEKTTRDGYEFDYYSSDKEGNYNFYDYRGKDTTVYAQWNKICTLTILDSDGEELYKTTFTKYSSSFWISNYNFKPIEGKVLHGLKDQDGNDFKLGVEFRPRDLDEYKDIVVKPVFSEPNASHEGWEARPF